MGKFGGKRLLKKKRLLNYSVINICNYFILNIFPKTYIGNFFFPQRNALRLLEMRIASIFSVCLSFCPSFLCDSNRLVTSHPLHTLFSFFFPVIKVF